jgi:hypothetical protein
MIIGHRLLKQTSGEKERIRGLSNILYSANERDKY